MAPIGVFDSGIGGLTVVKALRKILPQESLLYLGDTARLPYGTKSSQVVERYALNCAQFLVDKGAKVLVIACNTATAYGLKAVQQYFSLPVIGVIQPGAQLALQTSKNHRVGVIATEGTVLSKSYDHALDANIEIFSQACPLFVPLCEEGLTEHQATEILAKEYLDPLLQQNIDTLILGCTHYPLLKPLIQKIVGQSVTLIDSAEAVAKAVSQLLTEKKLHTTQTHHQDQFFATDVNARMQRVGSLFLGNALDYVELVHL